MHRIVFLVAFAASLAHAQPGWPGREVRVFIGFSAGGTTDIVTRLISADLSRAWGQPIETAKWAPLVRASGARVD